METLTAVRYSMLTIERNCTSTLTQGKPGMTNDLAMASTASKSESQMPVYVKAVLCLVVGLAAGYLVRASLSPASAAPRAASVQQRSGLDPIGAVSPTGTEAMKQIAGTPSAPINNGHMPTMRDRSEERRVGKECRSRW